MNLLDELKGLGVDVDEGIARPTGNPAFYEKMLFRFPDMLAKSSVNPDFDCNDYGEVIEQTHAIKGATGNLSLTPLFQAYDEIVALLRADQPQQAKEVLQQILPVQEKIVACIEKYA